MYRKQTSIRIRLAAMTAFALVASGVASADDNSMSRWTGDSYAFFNNLDNHPSGFNTARAPKGDGAVAKMPRTEPERSERRIMLADVPGLHLRNSPFRDDTGA